MVIAMTDPERPTAEPITALIADRVRRLRTGRGISQADLAAEMVKAGRVTWTRATVGNLERRAPTNSRATGAEAGRGSVSVGELLALAQALGVPPVWLLVDPTGGTAPITADTETDPWAALLWVVGHQQLDGQRAGGDWADAAGAIASASKIATWTNGVEANRYREPPHLFDPRWGPVEHNDWMAQLDKTLVENIRNEFDQLLKAGCATPPLSPYVLDRARQLGVDLSSED